MTLPSQLHYLPCRSTDWRRAAYLLHRESPHGLSLHPDDQLEFRDQMARYHLPCEAWIDFRILTRWVQAGVPIPLIVILDFVLSQQRANGSWSVDGRLPNSGACYRSLEYAARMGLEENDARLEKGLDFLENSLEKGGLRSPGPLPGMPTEVGTTARCLHVFSLLRPDSPAVREMQSWLFARLLVSGELACWHTDCLIDDPDQGITGATSLALFALLRCGPSDRETLGRVVRWLLRTQNPDGGWPDKTGASSSIDNTYNVSRALIEAGNQGIPIEGLKEALAKAERFVHLPVHLHSTSPSRLAMTLRARLLFARRAFERPVIESVDALVRCQEHWYTPNAHYYNAILICGLALAEWLDKAREEGNPYERTRDSRGLRFLLDFPVNIPPFYPGYRGGLYERVLGALAAGHMYPAASIIEETFTIRDFGGMVLGLILFFAFYVNTDLLHAVMVRGEGHAYTLPFALLYAAWLSLKWRDRSTTSNFLATTLFAWGLALGLMAWLGTTWGKTDGGIPSWHDWRDPAFWRLGLFFALMIDAGRRLVRQTHLDRIFTRNGPNR